MGDTQLSEADFLSAKKSLENLQQFALPVLSRPSTLPIFNRSLQRKLDALLKCDLTNGHGPGQTMRLALSVAERVVNDLLAYCQSLQHQTSVTLWTAIRSHGCQFLGPAMQEEVLKLILLALEDGSSLSRKVLILFVVQRLQVQFPQASKTAVGHVVQLLYRASCFNVIKRNEESSLMQLKEEYRSYDSLRCQHDTQIVEISLEFGLRFGPEQWSCLLFGDAGHRSHMQSVMDKISRKQTFCQIVDELLNILRKSEDLLHLATELQLHLEDLVTCYKNLASRTENVSWSDLDKCLKAILEIISVHSRALWEKRAHKSDNLSSDPNCKQDSGIQGNQFQTLVNFGSVNEPFNRCVRKDCPNHHGDALTAGFSQTCVHPVKSEFPSGVSASDEVPKLTDSFRSCSVTSSPASSSLRLDVACRHLMPSSLSSSSSSSSSFAESHPYHILPQFLSVVPPVLCVASNETGQTRLSAGISPSPIFLPLYNQASPSNFLQPL